MELLLLEIGKTEGRMFAGGYKELSFGHVKIEMPFRLPSGDFQADC